MSFRTTMLQTNFSLGAIMNIHFDLLGDSFSFFLPFSPFAMYPIRSTPSDFTFFKFQNWRISDNDGCKQFRIKYFGVVVFDNDIDANLNINFALRFVFVENLHPGQVCRILILSVSRNTLSSQPSLP